MMGSRRRTSCVTGGKIGHGNPSSTGKHLRLYSVPMQEVVIKEVTHSPPRVSLVITNREGKTGDEDNIESSDEAPSEDNNSVEVK